MPTITINVSDATTALLEQLAEQCTAIDKDRAGATSHGPLSVPALLEMLAEDAALVIRRPGSWEGANMHTVLTSHGYEL